MCFPKKKKCYSVFHEFDFKEIEKVNGSKSRVITIREIAWGANLLGDWTKYYILVINMRILVEKYTNGRITKSAWNIQEITLLS